MDKKHLNETIGDRLVALRNHFGKKQLEMAADFRVTAQTLSRYEKNERKPHAEFLEKVVRATKCNAHWLLNGEGEMFNGDSQKPQSRMDKIRDLFPGIKIDDTFMAVIDALSNPKFSEVLRHEFYIGIMAARSKFPHLFLDPGEDARAAIRGSST